MSDLNPMTILAYFFFMKTVGEVMGKWTEAADRIEETELWEEEYCGARVIVQSVRGDGDNIGLKETKQNYVILYLRVHHGMILNDRVPNL